MNSLQPSLLITRTISFTWTGLSGLLLLPGSGLWAQDQGLAAMSPADVQLTSPAQYSEGAVPTPITYAGESSAACLDGGAGGTCPPRRLTYGYYNPVWRRWPGDRGKSSAAPASILGVAAEPSLPAADAETDIYDPPRADESQAVEGSLPAEPSEATGPPALPPGLNSPAAPAPTEGAQWEEFSDALGEAEQPATPNQQARRPLTLRRAGTGNQERFRSQARTVAQVAYERPAEMGPDGMNGGEATADGAWQPSRRERSAASSPSGNAQYPSPAHDELRSTSGEDRLQQPSGNGAERDAQPGNDPRNGRTGGFPAAQRRNPLRNS